MKYALSGDAATLVWSQINPEELTVAHLQELLRETYGSAMQEEEFQAELHARRRKANEDLPTLRANISRLMSLAFPGDVSTMDQKWQSIILWMHWMIATLSSKSGSVSLRM